MRDDLAWKGVDGIVNGIALSELLGSSLAESTSSVTTSIRMRFFADVGCSTGARGARGASLPTGEVPGSTTSLGPELTLATNAFRGDGGGGIMLAASSFDPESILQKK